MSRLYETTVVLKKNFRLQRYRTSLGKLHNLIVKSQYEGELLCQLYLFVIYKETTLYV